MYASATLESGRGSHGGHFVVIAVVILFGPGVSLLCMWEPFTVLWTGGRASRNCLFFLDSADCSQPIPIQPGVWVVSPSCGTLLSAAVFLPSFGAFSYGSGGPSALKGGHDRHRARVVSWV